MLVTIGTKRVNLTTSWLLCTEDRRAPNPRKLFHHDIAVQLRVITFLLCLS